MSAGTEAVSLRGHHFVCLQFYRGEGYSATFVDNLNSIVGRSEMQRARLVAGADDVCAACPGLAADGTCVDEQAGEAEVTRLDALAWALLGASPGETLSLAEARDRIAADAVGAGRWRFEACAGCAWEDVCEPGWDELLGEG